MSPHFLAHYPIKVFDPTSPYDTSHSLKNLQFLIILLILKGYRVERHELGIHIVTDIKILRIIPPFLITISPKSGLPTIYNNNSNNNNNNNTKNNSITLFRIHFHLNPLNLDLKSTLNLCKVPRNATIAHILQSISLNHWTYLKPLKLSQSKLTSC